MNELTGKRLLLLGGGLWKEVIKEYAEKNGIVLIATGNDISSGIFQIADEGYLVDSTDAEAMKKLIVEKKIDGVYMGGSETVISVACKYLNEMGLHCYCTKEQWDFLENKANFKELCIKHGLPVAKSYSIDEEDIDTSSQSIDYPVITKPQDGCGSNGFSVCGNASELKRGYEIAKAASPSGSVICEKFVKNSGVVVIYTFSDGEMFFSGLEDKFPVRYEEQGSYVVGSLIFESNLIKEFREKFEDKLRTVFNTIGIKEGSLWIEVFHNDGQYYFNEVGYRYGGSVTIYPVDYYYQINQVGADINYALLGKSGVSDRLYYTPVVPSCLNRKKKYCVYCLHLAPGLISNVMGIKEILDNANVVAIPTLKVVGNRILSTGSFSQVYASVHFVFDTTDELRTMIEEVHKTIKVLDENGNNMVRKMVNISDVIESYKGVK